jgi:pre-rRNA-processing protein TSR3
MRSSGSTRNPPRETPVRLFIVLAGEDHPKACTGRRLLRRGLATEPAHARARSGRPIVLDPHADRPLSATDRDRAEHGGVLAIDCSWNRLAERGGLPGREGGPDVGSPHRRLPILIAANPQHYGRPAELNTVEALAASVYLLARPEQARALLDGFRGEQEFLELNRARLDAYAAAHDAEGVRSVERHLFGPDPAD